MNKLQEELEDIKSDYTDLEIDIYNLKSKNEKLQKMIDELRTRLIGTEHYEIVNEILSKLEAQHKIGDVKE